MIPGKKRKLEGRREQMDQPSRNISVNVVCGKVLAEPGESVTNVIASGEDEAESSVQILCNANSACHSFTRP